MREPVQYGSIPEDIETDDVLSDAEPSYWDHTGYYLARFTVR